MFTLSQVTRCGLALDFGRYLGLGMAREEIFTVYAWSDIDSYSTQERNCSPDIHRDRQVIALEGVLFHCIQNRWQEGAESVEEDILYELDESTAKY
jgi:hypothetical protein